MIADQIAAFLARLWGEPVTIADLARIPGGASRETYRFDAHATDKVHPLILRRDPGGSLIDTDRETEFLAYRSAHGVVPVPRAIALEPQGAELQRPFFLMERIDGGTVAGSFDRAPFGDHAAAMGESFFTALGRLAAFDPAATPLAAKLGLPSPERCWSTALEYWEGVIDADSDGPQPIVRAAIRRLRRTPPPPPACVRIVHGDYRSGNVMHDGAGGVIAILDWEMAHLGDPLEDLAWACDPLWTHFDDARVAGMVPRADAIAIWERASGRTADARALRWWSLFASVKGRAIWISAAKEYLAGGRTDPVLGLSGWYTAIRHDLILAEQLETWDA